MILRRITEHVKAQNWFAVGLDFIIVVVGVFIGIQVSNWNAAQQRAATADVFEARLIGDIRNEIGVIENRIEIYTDILTIADRLAVEITGPADALGPDFLRDAHFATSLWRFRRTQDTYDELLTSGELGLIADTKVRSELSRYYRDLDAVVGIWDKPTKFVDFVRMYIPASVQQQIRRHCQEYRDGEFEKVHYAIKKECQLDVSDAQLRMALDALLDPSATGAGKFSVMLNELIGETNFKVDQLKRKRGSAQDLLALMEAR